MEIDATKKLLEAVQELVSVVEEKECRVIAFELLMKKELGLLGSSVTPQINTRTPHSHTDSAATPAAKLAADAGVTEEQLKNVYAFKGNDVVLHVRLDGKDSEKQKIVAKLLLLGGGYVGQEELSGVAIGKTLSDLSITANNLKRNIDVPGIVLSSNRYKLNTVGKQDALALVKQYATNPV